jgi:hypothetical protein
VAQWWARMSRFPAHQRVRLAERRGRRESQRTTRSSSARRWPRPTDASSCVRVARGDMRSSRIAVDRPGSSITGHAEAARSLTGYRSLPRRRVVHRGTLPAGVQTDPRAMTPSRLTRAVGASALVLLAAAPTASAAFDLGAHRGGHGLRPENPLRPSPARRHRPRRARWDAREVGAVCRRGALGPPDHYVRLDGAERQLQGELCVLAQRSGFARGELEAHGRCSPFDGD